jgi:hypothetical protein
VMQEAIYRNGASLQFQWFNATVKHGLRVRKPPKEYLTRFAVSVSVNVRLASLWAFERIKSVASGFKARLHGEPIKLSERLKVL